MGYKRNPVDIRFWEKVNKNGPNGCWLWTAATRSLGYGVITDDAGRQWAAHRMAWTMLVGPIPVGLEIDHLCHVPACVNPEHLRIATRKENQEHRNGPYRNSLTGIQGVTFYKRTGRWRATVTAAGRHHHVGYFDTADEARLAVIAKRNELFTHNDLDRIA